MKTLRILLTFSLFAFFCEAQASSPREIWDQRATAEEKEALSIALDHLAEQTGRMAQMKSYLAGIGSKALGACQYTKGRGEAPANIKKPDVDCYNAVQSAFSQFLSSGHQILGKAPATPAFLLAGAPAAPAAKPPAPTSAAKAKVSSLSPKAGGWKRAEPGQKKK